LNRQHNSRVLQIGLHTSPGRGTLTSTSTPPINNIGTGTGAAYVFARKGNFWRAIQRLQPPLPAEEFGALLAVTPTLLVSIRPPTDRFTSPTLHVYEPRGPRRTYELKDQAQLGDFSGITDLAASGNTALVGVPFDSPFSTGHVDGYENAPTQ
jgi:hypothetical protein